MSAPLASNSAFPRLSGASVAFARAATGRGKQGFMLVDVMIAGTIFTMAALGLYALLFKAYELSALARYRDDARTVLQTYVTQFEQLGTTDSSNNPVALFNPNSTYYSTGLQYWISPDYTLSDQNTTTAVVAEPTVNLGSNSDSAGNSVSATVTYTVKDITTSTLPGTPDSGEVLLQATFTITYTVFGQTETQYMTAVRLTA